MPSRKSFCNAALYRKSVLRLWPLWSIAAFLLFLVVPASLWTNLRDLAQPSAASAGSWIWELSDGIPIFSAFLCCLAGMGIWSWLCTPRSAYHQFALPLRRESLFLTHLLAGLTVCILPFVLTALFTLGTEAILHCVDWKSLGTLLWMSVCSCLFFFSLFSLCAVISGHIIAMPAFFWIANFLVWGIYLLIECSLQAILFGMTAQDSSAIVTWFTPIANLMQEVRCIYNEDALRIGVTALHWYAVYAAVGLLIAGFGCILFRTRPAESAGDIVAFSWFRPVFQIGFTVCAALALSLVLCDIFCLYSVPLLLFLLLIAFWSFVAYFAAEMLLRKSVRVFQKQRIGIWAITCLCMLLLLIAVKYSGFERRIPAEERIASAEITVGYYDGFTVSSNDAAAIHNAILNGNRDGSEYPVQIVYRLKNGRSVSRSYAVNCDTEAFSLLLAQMTRPNTLTELYLGSLESCNLLADDIWIYRNDTDKSFSLSRNSPEAQQLLDALRQDFAEGNSGLPYRLGADESVTEIGSISVVFYTSPYQEAEWTGEADYRENAPQSWRDITVTSNMIHTVDLLETLH